MRRFFCALLALLLTAGGAAAEPLAQKMVRLQVVAESDTAEAQALKLEVRDECLRCAEACMAAETSAEAAYMRLEENLPAFESACAAVAAAAGYTGEIRLETGVFPFPDRLYGRLRVPAGEYRALRVTIGAGEGHNWWCVLYPSLCLLNEADYVQGETRVYSRVLTWLSKRIGGIL